MKIATMYFGRDGGLARFRVSRKHRLHLDLTLGFPVGALGHAVFRALDGKTVREARELCVSLNLPFRLSEMKPHEDHVQKQAGGLHGGAADARRGRSEPLRVHQPRRRSDQPGIPGAAPVGQTGDPDRQGSEQR